MANFKTRIKQTAKKKGKVILANDYNKFSTKLQSRTLKNITTLHNYLCGIKLNFHVYCHLELKKFQRLTIMLIDMDYNQLQT